MEKVKAGRLIRVDNKERRFGSAKSYLCVWVEDASGKNERPLLFTDNEIAEAEARATDNPEDLTRKSFLTNLFD